MASFSFFGGGGVCNSLILKETQWANAQLLLFKMIIYYKHKNIPISIKAYLFFFRKNYTMYLLRNYCHNDTFFLIDSFDIFIFRRLME